jgi:uncharacterized RmlC-like cupin family protein
MHDDRTPPVEGRDGLMWIRGSGVCRDWNGIRYKLGMSGGNVGATQLSMNVAMVPPGVVARSTPDEWDRIVSYTRSR